MSATKDMIFDCLENGVVPVNNGAVGRWAARLGRDASILDGMPMSHSFETRWGETIEVPVIPVAIAKRIGQILPDTHDCLGWLVELGEEANQ